MLDKFIKQMDYGVSYGSGVLKALQNDSMPEIDLLVREAIQNSSDASLGVDQKRFEVEFNIDHFTPDKLNAEIDGLTELLNERFPEKDAMFLEIRDKKTRGLTGPVRKQDLSEDHGNYFKLVFDTGKEQTVSSEGEAGGSWGYGKSVYYRVGIGLVIFYSQIKKGNSTEERMIFSLTEHEGESGALLKKIQKDSVGRAWWGKLDKDTNEILPLTDENDIQKILDIFQLKRFKAGQTGTSIIIPYINSSELLEGIFPDDCGASSEEKDACTWKDDLEKYIELAIKKWYAPKIFNKQLENFPNQKWLAVKVNGKQIRDDELKPFFRLIRELYTIAMCKNFNKSYKSEEFPNIECAEVASRKVDAKAAGYVAYVIITKEELSAFGNMVSPYLSLRLFNASRVKYNDPIVMFARTPGLVLDYKIDGEWTKRLIKPENINEFLVAFFVPNCTLNIKKDPGLGELSGTSFGEYLRKCEKSDHMDWNDKTHVTIISNIKTQVVNSINKGVKGKERKPIESTASRLSGKLGTKLLPDMTTGSRGGSSGGSSGGGSRSKADNLDINLNAELKKSCIEIKFELLFKNNRKNAELNLYVETEIGTMDAEAWEKGINNSFPIEIVAVKNINTHAINSNVDHKIEGECNPSQNMIESDYTKVGLRYTESGENVKGIYVSNMITNTIVTGSILIKSADKKFVCAIEEIKE